VRLPRQADFGVSAAEGGSALRRLLERELPALVLLDVGLPGEDGFALARWLREKSGRIGIIMVTAASERLTAWLASKPAPTTTSASPTSRASCSPASRACCAARLGRRPRPGRGCGWAGRRVLDLEKRVLADPADGSEETLTASEFDLLKLFAENPNRPLQRDWLLESAAHREMEAFDRAIDLRITRLRRKIETDPAHPDAIRTVRGIGYMFVPPKD
jgi:two-component system phosphate regulon response regulator OmpR